MPASTDALNSCPHLIDTTCHAIEPFPPSQETCRACTRLGRGINQISVLACLSYKQQEGEPLPLYLINYLEKTQEQAARVTNLSLLQNRGPGTILKTLLSWFVTQPPNCACADRAKLMNLWGKEKCLAELPTILGWLRESALDNNVTYSEFVVTCLVKFAIRISK